MKTFGKRLDGPGGRRSAPRAPVAMSAAMHTIGASRTVGVLDVSKTGAQLRSREPVHMHPYDLVVVPLTPGLMEVLVGPATTVKEFAPGEVIFLPRDVPHSLSSRHADPIEVVSVGIK